MRVGWGKRRVRGTRGGEQVLAEEMCGEPARKVFGEGDRRGGGI
jgi:hypothetical protein